MKNIKTYNIYMFISTLTRNIIDIYSVVLLYQKGFSIQDIIGIYAITYFIGSYISTLSIEIGNKIGYKYILIISSIITSISFYAINTIKDPLKAPDTVKGKYTLVKVLSLLAPKS